MDIGLKKYSYVEMEFFLPNGQCFSMNISPTFSMAKVKSLVWQHASSYPLFNRLKKHNYYIFSYIDSNASIKTILNDSLTLIEVQMGKPLLILVENEEGEQSKGDSRFRKTLNSTLGDKSIRYSSYYNEEYQDFLTKYIPVCLFYSKERTLAMWEINFLYIYPPDVGTLPDIPIYLKTLLSCESDGEIYFYIMIDKNTRVKIVSKLLDTPKTVLTKAIGFLCQKGFMAEIPASDCLLKIVGQENFLFGIINHKTNMVIEVPLIRFNYIRNCVSLNMEPVLSIVERKKIILPDFAKCIPDHKLEPVVSSVAKHFTNLWTLDSTIKFNVIIGTSEYINDAECQYFVQGGIFLGDVRLSDVQQTKMRDGPNPKWNEKLTFDIAIINLPKNARICLSICSIPSSKSKKKGGVMSKVSWCNINLFNHNGLLTAGTIRMVMWKYGDPNLNSTLQPLGTVCSAPESHYTPILNLLFNNYPVDISYPCKNEIIKYGELFFINNTTNPSQEYIATIDEILKTDYLMPLSEQCKSILWDNRYFLLKERPLSLKRLAESVQWNRKEHVAHFIYLIQSWPQLLPEDSLMLLDGAFPLQELRSFAVSSLRLINDEKLECYLLQIIECMKLEAYIDSSLCEFILTRSLLNSRIGHFFFWQIKSEMSSPENYERFSTIIEAYFYGAPHSIEDLTRQVEFISKLRTLTELMTQQNDMDTENRKQLLRKCLSIKAYSDVISNITNPLEPRIKVGALKFQKCDVKESKKKPLVICWKNKDECGTDVSVLFKNGDDLRQDILTLKTFRIMDMVWKESGYDFKLIPYSVLATGYMCGLIELVGKSATLGKIQLERGFKKTVLYDWLQEKCQNDSQKMQHAIDLFRLTCCGYSIATFVLGIGDRHNDNVMLKENGQLFHIDFGHFLGNFKSFFGIKRERVPFILTKDFIYLATNTKDDKDSDDFKSFSQLCEDSFLILRSRSNFFIILFSLMISSGMPELNKMEDLHFLRNTFHVGKENDQASLYFQEKFKEAYNGGWMTQMNFRAHTMRISQAQSSVSYSSKILQNFDIN